MVYNRNMEKIFAATCEGVSTALISCGDDESGIGHILGLVIGILSAAIGVLGVLGIVYSGAQYLTARGNEEQVRKAKRRILEIVIGLAAYAVAAAFLQWLLPGGITKPEDLPHYEKPETSTEDPSSGSGSGSSGSDSGGTGGNVTPSTPTVKYNAGFSLKNDSTFPYWLNVPNNATSGMPLVVFLHGDGEMGSSSAVQGLPGVQYMANASRSYISVAPVGSNYDWSGSGKQQDLMTLINKVASDYNVDKNRIYLMGFSRGAIGTWDLVSSNPNYFAAAVPVSCGPSSANAANFKHTKIWAISGNVGDEATYSSRMQSFVNQINNNGGSAKYDMYSGMGHGNMQGALRYNEIFDWLLKQ